MAKKYTKKDLVAAAEDFNKALELDPQIGIGEDVTVAQLEKDIKDVIENHLEAGDKISDPTIKLIGLMGLKKPEKPAAKAKAKADKKDKGGEATAEPPAKGTKDKKKKKASPYSIMLDVICANPNMTRKEFAAALAKKSMKPGEDYKTSAFGTAYSSTISIVKRLQANGLMK